MVQQGHFDLKQSVGFCNAIRRTLVSDLANEAPCRVTIRTNTTCQTDEYLAHRVGMIPFRRVGNGDTMTLTVRDRPAISSDFVGPAFEACEEVELMRMQPGQCLDMTVHFDRHAGSKHARYSMVAAVGMHKVKQGVYRISFETNDGSAPKDSMHRALDAFEKRVDDALLELSRQDQPPPKSMC